MANSDSVYSALRKLVAIGLLSREPNLAEEWSKSCSLVDEEIDRFRQCEYKIKVQRDNFIEELKQYTKFGGNDDGDRVELQKRVKDIMTEFENCCKIAKKNTALWQPKHQPNGPDDAPGQVLNSAARQIRQLGILATEAQSPGRAQNTAKLMPTKSRPQQTLSTRDEASVQGFVEKMETKMSSLAAFVRTTTSKNPIFIIRTREMQPTLWRDNEAIRNELYSLHNRFKNVAAFVPRAIQLQFGGQDFYPWIQQLDLDKKLSPKSPPIFFRLEAVEESAPEEPQSQLLVATPISSPGPRLQDLQWHDVDMEDNNDKFNFRLVHDFEFGDRPTLDAVISDTRRCSLEDRITVAAHIAVAYLQFATVNLGNMPRKAKNYRVRLSSRNTESGSTKTQVWLENGFGKQPARDMRDTYEEIEQTATKELGRLLLQIFSFSLNGGDCVYRPLVRACSEAKPDASGRPYEIIEEVAAVLRPLHRTEKLRRQ
ncbi:hypothetical protein NQ176_g5903 [Zarea fungicola]|uniref:Uncharacterized protein n=1 Tax=Zarea fungicola TaxID=93591 RepID=A0ACC1N8B4_9HYPO|nr:hypothetical protein NQ176_g5903 [Lecanicillium fungicola]